MRIQQRETIKLRQDEILILLFYIKLAKTFPPFFLKIVSERGFEFQIKSIFSKDVLNFLKIFSMPDVRALKMKFDRIEKILFRKNFTTNYAE